MTGIKIGYARVSTTGQDLTAQRTALTALGVEEGRVYVETTASPEPTAPAQAYAKPWPHAGPVTPWW